jgi:hypothetical protein
VSLYREAGAGRQRRRLLLGAAAAAVAVAALIAVLLLRDDSAPAGRAALQDDVRPALAALELVPIHYESPTPATHAAAADQLAVARETVAEHGDALRGLDAAAAAELEEELGALERLVGTTGEVEAVEQAAARATRTLRELVGLPARGGG